jgi:hypothetical protein
MRARMPRLQSNEDCFRAIEGLIARLELEGHRQAADDLRSGYRCLNGLTDGWALLLESLDQIQATQAVRFSVEDQEALEAIRLGAYMAVYRR